MSSAVPRFAARAPLAVLLALAACTNDETPGADSLANLPAFTLDSTRTVTIADDGSAERQFTRIAARRLNNGDIAIGDRGSSRIMIFGRDGTLKTEVAHKGSGPGELPGDFRLTSAGDTLLAFEQSPMSTSAVHVFDATNGPIMRFTPHAQNDAGRMTALARISTNTWVVQRGTLGRVINSVPAIGEFMPDSQTLGLLHVSANVDSSNVQWLPTFVRSWMVVVPLTGATGANGAPTTLPVTFAFKASTLNAASGDLLWMVNTVTGEIVAYDANGTRVVGATLQIPTRKIDLKEIANERDVLLAGAKNPVAKASASGRFYEPALPKSLPLFSEAIAGANGELWLKLFEISSKKPQRFVVVARDGEAIATMVLPPELRLQHIGRDFILALLADNVGIESVVEFRLRRK